MIDTYKVNVISMFILCREMLPRMKQGSSIINVSSIQAYNPDPIAFVYASTKAAIINFTKGLAKMAVWIL
jgi:NAD(P)-dependent dehydrogenase (short-subunit alcohol dehydrogenase family)